MARFWQWGWQRFGHRYSWVVRIVGGSTYGVIMLPSAWVTLRFEQRPDLGLEALAIVAVMSVICIFWILPPAGPLGWTQIDGWPSTPPSLALSRLEASYPLMRRSARACLTGSAIAGGLIGVALSMAAGVGPSRMAQYALLLGLIGGVGPGVGGWAFFEAALHPVRESLADHTVLGEDLPRATPSFAARTTVLLLSTTFVFSLAGAAIAGAFGIADREPIAVVVVAFGLFVTVGFPLNFATGIGTTFQPLRDLSDATERVAMGDFSQRLRVVQDDDLGVLAASFNRMQAGLAERERLQAAFGSYVDPSLAERLLAQGDDLFSGERVEITVMFVDIRDFTPFAEANSAEVTVAHLNALFGIVIDVVDELGGHVNKFLGDGAMVVFGAPEQIGDHADRAVACATRIQRRITDRFDDTVRVGIGINTGTVIAGTIGSSKKLEFTLIGDAVNVAARVEQLTKTTGDATLLTHDTLDSLTTPPDGLTDRGSHELKGKAEPVAVYALDHRVTTLT